MKLHIVKPGQESIENYARVEASPNALDISMVSDNECTSIMANDILDLFSIDNVPKVLEHLATKMRMGGDLVVGGTDVRLFCKYVTNDQVDELSAAQLIGNCESMTTLDQISNILQSLGLNVVSSQVSGMHYEIKAARG
tara:strand:- start:192 stop:608 length:417 start_codon:yes stop_codon:yes gene_type:complete